MTSFIEELSNGDCFDLSGSMFVLTSDSKKDGSRLCISLKDGNSRWLKPDSIVIKIGLFYTDSDGNIIAIKEMSKQDVNA